ncbi:protein kinase family protein [Lewinella cohaerens]|uniref:protein kinase family protein n=1 Tax=Lewinella cohaerens TaxID=70995 RepID=UPI0003790832|nr:protein kinase family protein [Lewinella cohaerens]
MEEIRFLRKKDYKKIKDIGQGGTGKTVLIEDTYINQRFICKKYSPLYEEHKAIYYKNFVEEIKLLHLLYHQNVVRVFNYYLYPEFQTGYILMEFVKGESINKYLQRKPEEINDIFRQVVEGFKHLEENEILHRDIRPDNILVSQSGIVKIIDFGFGKKINFNSVSDKSISINWRYSVPNDFKEKKYDQKTEVYFVGKLFEEIILENDLSNFGYTSILSNMIDIDPTQRIQSFFEVSRKLSSHGKLIELEFTEKEKEAYANFAHFFSWKISKIHEDATYRRDVDQIERDLKEIYRHSILEDYIQDSKKIFKTFIQGNYYYSNSGEPMLVDSLKSFLELLKSSDLIRKRVIINNLWNRIDAIKRYIVDEDDLPF